MESKTKKMIIIGALIFLAVVVATLSITLPLTLRGGGDDQMNNNTTNSSTIATMTTESMKDQSSTSGPSQMSDVSLQDTSSSLQKEPVRVMINKAFGLFKQSSVPLSFNLDNQEDITGSRSKSSKK